MFWYLITYQMKLFSFVPGQLSIVKDHGNDSHYSSSWRMKFSKCTAPFPITYELGQIMEIHLGMHPGMIRIGQFNTKTVSILLFLMFKKYQFCENYLGIFAILWVCVLFRVYVVWVHVCTCMTSAKCKSGPDLKNIDKRTWTNMPNKQEFVECGWCDKHKRSRTSALNTNEHDPTSCRYIKGIVIIHVHLCSFESK